MRTKKPCYNRDRGGELSLANFQCELSVIIALMKHLTAQQKQDLTEVIEAGVRPVVIARLFGLSVRYVQKLKKANKNANLALRTYTEDDRKNIKARNVEPQCEQKCAPPVVYSSGDW